LKHRLPLLTAGPRDAPARHKTLRGTIAWSYELLDIHERLLFRELAIFASGCTLEALEHICTAAPALALLARLTAKSLVRQAARGREARFVMLETTREYALEQLQSSGGADSLRARHAQYYLSLAEAAQPEFTGSAQAACLERLEHDHPNFRAALEWALDAHESDTGLALAGALSAFWEARGHLAEGRRWLDAALANGDDARPVLRRVALHGAGRIATRQGEYDRAASYLEQALALGRVHAGPADLAATLIALGGLSTYQGDYPRARERYEESLAIRREAGILQDPRSMGILLHNLGTLAATEGDYARARPLLEEGSRLSPRGR
jgi:tetratricopeptide (TPR) repeat protein